MTEVMRFGAPTSRSHLVVASYNIHGCIGTDRKHDPSRIAQDPSRLTVVLGDINEWFSPARTLRQLGKHFGQSSTVRTWPSRRPLFALDRIWVHPPEALASVWAHNSPTARRASDHLPLVGVIKT